jgi:hypothetical protein
VPAKPEQQLIIAVQCAGFCISVQTCYRKT